MSVLAFHTGAIGGGNGDGFLGRLGSGLWIGVPIFFLLSGFLLYRPFVSARAKGAQVDVKRYAQRRVLRIVPAYWVALTVLAIGASLPGVFTADWWRYYGFLQVYSDRTLGLGMGVAWTLCVEVVFYALLPVYALVAVRLGVRQELALLAALALGSLTFRTLLIDSHWAFTFPGTFVWFVPGMLLAIASVHGAGRLAAWGSSRALVCWGVALATYIALCFAGPELVTALAPVVAFWLVLPAVFAGTQLPHRLLGLSPLIWVGTISYAIYLYHATFMAWLNDHGANGWINLFLVTTAVTVVAAAGSWYLLERPILEWKRTKRQRPRIEAESANAHAAP
jgi:peptidoglycan/LPS O-acetylase OafA/YrhL